MIASHAASNGVPAELVHRVIVRESRYRANAMGRGGASGLMQIKLATARSMGYSGSAAGLLDPDTNLTYGVRYLAGAYRAASGTSRPRCRLLRERLSRRGATSQRVCADAGGTGVFSTAASRAGVVVERKIRRKRR